MRSSHVRVCVLTVGDELLAGEVLDTNHGTIAAALSGLGFEVVRHLTVADVLEDITAAVRELASRSEVLMVTGGLGPTNDDLTCEAVARAAGVELEFHPHLEENLRRFFASMHREMPDENLKQAYLPAGSIEIPTAGGTAPGFMLELSGTLVVSLPGVPSEVADMLASHVVPALEERYGRSRVTLTERVLCFGAGESDVASLVADRIAGGPVRYGFLIDSGSIAVKLTAEGSDRAEALAAIEEERAAVLERLGFLAYGSGDDTMESVLGDLLEKKGLTVAFAESVTAGMAAARLANVPGSSSYLLGGIVAYSREAKTDILGIPAETLDTDVVSTEVAEAMASLVKELFGADLGVSTTGVAGPGSGGSAKPVGTVAVAIAHADGVISLERRLPGGRAMIRNLATLAALNMIRLHLEFPSGTDP
jgi:nicotinamide-nucleotide amidase